MLRGDFVSQVLTCENFEVETGFIKEERLKQPRPPPPPQKKKKKSSNQIPSSTTNWEI